ncbi:hypothetical protein CDN99_10575 [Roseateles aquatilis]|uniref:SGNH hydrolase-type esterase domain-containing protein n=1 Tax=Roseateles aquatilis TaxID=431061 RepID=A0A246JFY4_9BURK|nr:hypothetical protein [Roseateles aquatilis]OWQ91574.1 hypothetical protein CDN99_10575 [Roseateles aquatilis]
MTTEIYSHQDLMDDRIDFNQFVPVIAHGDSWGSFGSLPPWITGSLFNHMDFGKDVAIVNYAMPGQLLRDLPDPKRFAKFNLAMTLRGMPNWRAMLISGGGNDLIDWIRRGEGVDITHRILRYPDEWLPVSQGPTRYLSQAGWVNLCQELLNAYVKLDALRDGNYAQMEIVTHVYDYMTPRFAPALNGVSGPWMAPGFHDAGIPADQWQAVARVLVDGFHDFLVNQVKSKIGGFVVLDTRGGSIPAAPGTTGISNDWANEIHLTASGYDKLAKAKCDATLQDHAQYWTTGATAGVVAPSPQPKGLLAKSLAKGKPAAARPPAKGGAGKVAKSVVKVGKKRGKRG